MKVTHEEGVRRLHSVLDQADAIDWDEGMIVYERYRRTMERFASYYDFTLAQVTACFVALSPNNDYRGNLKSMATVLHGIRSGWPLDEIVVTTYNQCRNRAYAFATGVDFLSITKGPKTRAFYSNILNPLDPSPVTVDGHMLGIWSGKRVTMVEATSLRIPYESVAHGIRSVAFSRFIIGNQAQAVLWFAWKRMHNVVYTPQLHLFRTGDQWGNDVQPESVRVFPRRRHQTILCA